MLKQPSRSASEPTSFKNQKFFQLSLPRIKEKNIHYTQTYISATVYDNQYTGICYSLYLIKLFTNEALNWWCDKYALSPLPKAPALLPRLKDSRRDRLACITRLQCRLLIKAACVPLQPVCGPSDKAPGWGGVHRGLWCGSGGGSRRAEQV